jgi:hypothetical protein
MVTIFTGMLLGTSFHMKQNFQSIAEPILSIADVIGLILVQTTGVNTFLSKKNVHFYCTTEYKHHTTENLLINSLGSPILNFLNANCAL